MTEAVTLTCADCPMPISGRGKTNLCRPCAARRTHADPAFRARLEAASREAKRTPEARARAASAAQRKEAARRGDPAWQAYKIASGKRLRADYEASAEGQAKNRAKRAEAGRKISATRLAHIPDTYRARYRELRKLRGAAFAETAVLAEAGVAARRGLDADAAAGWLARLAPTYRCDDRGRPDRSAGYWRYGSAVLTRDELLERAARRGWPPAATMAVGAAS